MTLSAAIRLGALLKPQGYDAFEKDGRTCAIGAAFDAIGCWDTECDVLWPICATRVQHPFVEWQKQISLYAVVFDLNDEYHWTREAIADWVESIEAQHESQPEAGQQNLTEALR